MSYEPYGPSQNGHYGAPSGGAQSYTPEYQAPVYYPPVETPPTTYGQPQGYAVVPPQYAAPDYVTGYPPPAPPPAPQPPPRKGRHLPWIIAVIAVIVLIAISVGVFSAVGLLADKAGDPTASSSPSASASPQDTRQVIAPAGAGYSYRLPTGFAQLPASALATTLERASGVAPTATDARNQITVEQVHLLNGESPAGLTETELATKFDAALRQGGIDPSSRQRVTVNGYPAFRYQITTGAGQSGLLYETPHGAAIVEVFCRWDPAQEASLTKACTDVTDSLHID